MKKIKVSSKKIKANLDKLLDDCKPNTDERNGKPIGYRPSRAKLLAKLCVYLQLNVLNESEWDYYNDMITSAYKQYK